MGRKFFDNLGGTCVYNCENCGVYLTNEAELMSTNFTGVTGQAFLFKNVRNVRIGRCDEREMLTGLHFVRDVFCLACDEKIGWMYELAINATERYKEGAVTLERKLIKKIRGFEEEPQRIRNENVEEVEYDRAEAAYEGLTRRERQQVQEYFRAAAVEGARRRDDELFGGHQPQNLRNRPVPREQFNAAVNRYIDQAEQRRPVQPHQLLQDHFRHAFHFDPNAPFEHVDINRGIQAMRVRGQNAQDVPRRLHPRNMPNNFNEQFNQNLVMIRNPLLPTDSDTEPEDALENFVPPRNFLEENNGVGEEEEEHEHEHPAISAEAMRMIMEHHRTRANRPMDDNVQTFEEYLRNAHNLRNVGNREELDRLFMGVENYRGIHRGQNEQQGPAPMEQDDNERI